MWPGSSQRFVPTPCLLQASVWFIRTSTYTEDGICLSLLVHPNHKQDWDINYNRLF